MEGLSYVVFSVFLILYISTIVTSPVQLVFATRQDAIFDKSVSNKFRLENNINAIPFVLASQPPSEPSPSENIYFDSIYNLSRDVGHSEFPQILANGKNVCVVWTDDTLGNRDIYFIRSTDNGATFGSIINLSNHSGGSLDPQLAMSGSNVYVVWEHTPGNNGEIFFARSTDNGATFDRTKNLGNNTGFNGYPQLAASGSNVYVVWHDASNGVNFRRSTDNGATFESPINLSKEDEDKEEEEDASNGSEEDSSDVLSFHPHIVTAAGSNNVYVVWYNGTTVEHNKDKAMITDIIYVRSTDNGATFESPINLSNYSGWALNPDLAVSEGNNVYVVWNDNSTENEEIVLRKSIFHSNNYNSSVYSDKSEVANFHNDTAIYHGSRRGINIALVDNTFTAAAYDKSFYFFYDMKHTQGPNITRHTSLLSSKVTQQYPDLAELDVIIKHLKWLTPDSNITALTDADVHERSSIFMEDGTNKYDVIILGHQEYVTQQEYDNLKQFVANGGIMILLDGNVFYAEVKYDRKAHVITLVKGHSWAFDGKSAWPSVQERWANETSEWVGSNYLCCFGDDIRFANNPFGVIHNEEQYITNPNTKILLNYNATENESNPRDFIIATYELDYKKGKVIALGLYTDDLLFYNERFKRFFDSLMFQYALGINEN